MSGDRVVQTYKGRVTALGFIVLLAHLSLQPLLAQDAPRQWERRMEATRSPLTIFHSTQAINLPTATTLGRGEWQFEIAHRFFPALSEGQDAFWGLDGPAVMRIALGFAPTDQSLITLGRSNLQDNWDLQGKLRIEGFDEGPLPLTLALQGGVGWSSEVSGRDSWDRGNLQYYGQIILNSRLGERFAVGLVPSYLHNTRLERVDPVQDFYLGLYSQIYLTDVLSLLAEWNVADGHPDLPHDPGAFGIELETGGHFFKVFLTNSVRLNPSQYLVGSDVPFEADEWRLGFAITRLLRF